MITKKIQTRPALQATDKNNPTAISVCGQASASQDLIVVPRATVGERSADSPRTLCTRLAMSAPVSAPVPVASTLAVPCETAANASAPAFPHMENYKRIPPTSLKTDLSRLWAPLRKGAPSVLTTVAVQCCSCCIATSLREFRLAAIPQIGGINKFGNNPRHLRRDGARCDGGSGSARR